jgi:hypothetical protein
MESNSITHTSKKGILNKKEISANKLKENLLNDLIFNIEFFNNFLIDLKNIHPSKRNNVELEFFHQFLKMINNFVEEIKKAEFKRNKGGRPVDETANLAMEILFDHFYSFNKTPPTAKWLVIEVTELFLPMNKKIDEINIEKIKNKEKLSSLLKKTEVDEKTARNFIRNRCEKYKLNLQ